MSRHPILPEANEPDKARSTRPDPPRYTDHPFPPYRYLPYRSGTTTPHPRNDRNGHSYGSAEVYIDSFSESNWQSCDAYLYGIDLFNYGYWWEAHEALEGVWLAAGQRGTLCGRFVQGLIQLCGAQLKRFMHEERGAHSLTIAGSEKISETTGTYLGIEITPFLAEVERCLSEDQGEFPTIELKLQV